MKKREKIAICVNNISKRYILHHHKPTLVESFLGKKKEFWALKDINLTIKKGEKLAVIGPNGAGKSTLLKIISGITFPTTGEIKINGKIASLIEITAGFHPDLTGKENIFLNGLLLGMKREEIKNKYLAIVKFSGLKNFINAPFYTYSRGMMLRLGFSIALHSEPDILIVDEILSAGDQVFQEKCRKRMTKIFRDKTILFVSHNLEEVKSLCPQTVILDKGRIFAQGETNKVIKKYLKFKKRNV
jgi:lipopolysaccharide transport system ATP-binding protein